MAALLITALGDGIWHLIPCAWGIRFNQNYFLINYQSKYTASVAMNQIVISNSDAVRNCIIVTLLVGIFLAVWFNYFEGRGEV